MEPPTAQKLEYFSRLLTCGQNLYYWQYDPALQLISTSCPQADVIGAFLALSGCRDYLLAAIHRGETKTLILSDTMGLSWIASFELAAQQLCRVHVIGPAFNSDISSRRVERQLIAARFSPQVRQSFLEQLRQLPVIQVTAWMQFGLMLHYTVTGEKISISDLAYQAPLGGNIRLDEDEVRTPKSGTWLNEQLLMQMIEEGRLDYQDAFSRMSESAGEYTEYSNQLPLRQMKNDTLVMTALCTRAALRGGLDAETAYYVGEYYTNHIEEATTVSELMRINSTMYDDFVRRVHEHKAAEGVSSTVQACRSYIELHITERITLKQLAANAGYTEYYLTQKFKKETGKSITQYIKEQKVERAKQLLRHTNQSIQDISESLGFCNHSYFTSTFYSIVGMTPGEYRESV